MKSVKIAVSEIPASERGRGKAPSPEVAEIMEKVQSLTNGLAMAFEFDDQKKAGLAGLSARNRLHDAFVVVRRRNTVYVHRV